MSLFYKKPFLFSLIGFCIFFYLCDISVIVFFLFVDLILLIILLLFKNSRSAFFAATLSMTISAMISYFFIHILQGHILRAPTNYEYMFIMIYILFCMDYYARMYVLAEDNTAHKGALFKEQAHDIARLRHYIFQFPLLGINAKWGNGKSFVWQHLKHDPAICAVFDIIQIDLLAVDLDSVELVLINELECLLERHHIHPQSSRNLKLLLGHATWLRWIVALLNNNNAGLYMSFAALQTDLSLLKKKVLICYEDIDRITDTNKIKKIFAIAEKLSSEQIHFIFQYNIDLLYAMDSNSISYDYMEKYMPFTVSLTEINYQNLVQKLWTDLNMESLPLDLRRISYIGFTIPSFWGVNNILNYDCQTLASTKINVDSLVSIRKARNYLLELKALISSNNLFSQQKNAEIVAYVLFIKHFFPKDYETITVGESPLETFYFKCNGMQHTLPELLKKYKRPDLGQSNVIKEDERIHALSVLLEQPDNGRKLTLLMLLGYDLSLSANTNNDEEATLNKLQIEEKNSKIDHIVWNIIANGNSELTDTENDIAQLKKIVLRQSPENWGKSWNLFIENRFNENFPKNNTTVARFGHGPFIDTFRAMQVTGSGKDIQSHLLPIFFSLYSKKSNAITVDLLECLVCCDLTQKQDFFNILRFFNTLTVKFNPVAAPVYRIFFSRFMRMIYVLGYGRHLESGMFELPLSQKSQHDDKFNDIIKDAQQCLAILSQVLVDLRNKQDLPYSLPYVQKEYDVLIAFINKNQEMLKADVVPFRSGFKVTTKNISQKWSHQDEIDRLLELRKVAPEKFDQELQESYQAGKLYLQELEVIISKF